MLSPVFASMSYENATIHGVAVPVNPGHFRTVFQEVGRGCPPFAAESKRWGHQKPSRASPSGEARSFLKARFRICRMRSRVTPRSEPISSNVISSPSSRPK